MNAAEHLRAARWLIERGWTQLATARDANGARVDWDSEDARSFCAMGALARAYRGRIYPGVLALNRRLRPSGIALPVMTFNDDLRTTQADVLALFDSAIAAEEAASPAPGLAVGGGAQ